MKKNQYGFAAVEAVIIVVVLAVVAGLGWYVYQKNQKDDKKTTISQKDNTSTDGSKDTDDQKSDVKGGYITISEWGVRAPYDGDQKLKYKINGDPRFAYFGSEQLTAQDPACNFETGGGMIRRFAPTDRTHVDDSGPTAEEAAKTDSKYHKVGNYYYRFVHDQSGCGSSEERVDQNQPLQQQVNALVEALVPKLVAVP